MDIAINALTKKYKSIYALDRVSIDIKPGQIVAVLGPNGAGKTTLLRCLSGIVAPDSGHIIYDGEFFNRGRVDLRRRLNFLPDFPLLFPAMSVARQIGMIAHLYGLDQNGVGVKVVNHLRELDLLPYIDTPIQQLSRGQIYKVALTALLAVDPELWMLDEPFASGMDPHGIKYFKKQVWDATARGHTILYSTQILDIAEIFADKICLIDHGQLRLFDSVSNLRAKANLKNNVLEDIFEKLREEQQ